MNQVQKLVALFFISTLPACSIEPFPGARDLAYGTANSSRAIADLPDHQLLQVFVYANESIHPPRDTGKVEIEKRGKRMFPLLLDELDHQISGLVAMAIVDLLDDMACGPSAERLPFRALRSFERLGQEYQNRKDVPGFIDTIKDLQSHCVAGAG